MDESTNIYLTEQIRQLEALAYQASVINPQELMLKAGEQAFEYLSQRFMGCRNILVYAGCGNNGGDGYALAYFAARQGLNIRVLQVGDHSRLKPEAKHSYQLCREANIPIQSFARTEQPVCDVAVDALIGIGLTQNVRDETATAIMHLQNLQKPILALDIPSGIDADTGSILGIAVQANSTITFIGLKLGLLTSDGIACAGEVVSTSLGLPKELFKKITAIGHRLKIEEFSTLLKKRHRNWHKGLSGHVVIVGGELGYSGAPRMAAEAALRVGAGLVSVATHPDNALVMNIECPEIMCHGIENANELLPLLTKADVVVLGPGLGQTAWSRDLWQAALSFAGPLVIDADGLNMLAEANEKQDNYILTPHPGEAARLLGTTSKEIQANRLQACKNINNKFGGVCVLKGAGTLVYDSDHGLSLCDRGNPGMASAGMGDVLSGVIGGLVGQRIGLYAAAQIGVLVHALAGDRASIDGERGMLAMDLMPYLRQLVNSQ